jgi:BspA type Leucine rich repeat region (6 copies)
MKTNSLTLRTINPNTVAGRFWTACAARQLALLLLLMQPAVVQAQFNIITNNGTITITGYTGSGGAVTIPGMINGLPVTSIGTNAFYSSTNLTNVTIPNSVTNIGDAAFTFCSNLTNVTLSTNLTSLGYLVFARCGSLSSITIPNSVTNIGGGVFLFCSMTNVTLSTNLISIGDSAFSSCYGLTNVTIPNSVTSIGEEAFHGCHSLTSVTIPSSVTSIGESAFNHCTSLTNVTIGNSVTNIGDMAFYWCRNLGKVYFQGDAPTFDPSIWNVFDMCPVTIYYLPGTTGWDMSSWPNSGFPTALWLPQVQTSGSIFGVQSNQFGFNINWASGQTVVVEACTNFANPVWQPVQTNTLTGGSCYFSDPTWTNYPARFYRLRSP